MGDASAATPLAEAMNRLWNRFLPQMEERVATLQTAAERLASGTLTEDEQHHAGAEAHKLAGVLGTFGLQDGTELAREAEDICASQPDLNPATVQRLSLIAEQLKALLASREQVS